MTADGALAEDHEAGSEQIRAFHRDPYRNELITAPEIVLRPQADAFAAVHVHRVVRHYAAVFGEVVLEHRRRHRRLLAAVDRACGDRARRIHDVREPGHARQHIGDAFEIADRYVELTTDARIRARGEHRGFAGAGGVRGQGDAAAHGKLLDEHAPTLAGHLRPADDEIERHEHILSLDGA